MDIVLGVSMEPTAVRLVLVEGENADGVTVEEDSFGAADSGAPAQVIAALVGTREGAAENGHHLTSAGVTWTDPAAAAVLRKQLAMRDVGSVMLVSPLLAAAALAQTVGSALYYPHIAMLFVEADSATLAIVDVADGSIVDLHRQPLGRADLSVEVAAMLDDLDAPGSRAKGVFVVGCGVDIVGIKPALEAATSLVVSFPEEPHLALARGAALASANAPLFASSTAALAYALDPGTGEVNSQALTQTYLDVSANADLGHEARAYSAWSDDDDDAHDADARQPRRRLALAGSAMAAMSAIAAGVLVVSLTSDVRPTALTQPSPPKTIAANQAPAQVTVASPPAQLPAPSTLPATPVAEAVPPPVIQQPTVVQQAPPTMANAVPAPRRQPTRQAPPPVQTPVPQAAPPSAPPAAPPAPPEPVAPPTPIATMYLHVPFVTIPIPIYPPAPPAPPAPPEPGTGE